MGKSSPTPNVPIRTYKYIAFRFEHAYYRGRMIISSDTFKGARQVNADKPNVTRQQEMEMGTVGLRLFFRLAEKWSLSQSEQINLLGDPGRTTLHRWHSEIEQGKHIRLSKDTIERLSYIAGIYKALQLLFENKENWNEWIKKPNSAFGGQSALSVMLGGNVVDLATVRAYLDAQRGTDYL